MFAAKTQRRILKWTVSSSSPGRTPEGVCRRRTCCNSIGRPQIYFSHTRYKDTWRGGGGGGGSNTHQVFSVFRRQRGVWRHNAQVFVEPPAEGGRDVQAAGRTAWFPRQLSFEGDDFRGKPHVCDICEHDVGTSTEGLCGNHTVEGSLTRFEDRWQASKLSTAKYKLEWARPSEFIFHLIIFVLAGFFSPPETKYILAKL